MRAVTENYYGENYEEDHSSNERKPSTKLYPASRLLLAILQAASRLTHEYGKMPFPKLT